MRPHDRLHLTGQSQHGVWTREQARACGFADSTIHELVERGEWRRWFDGPVFSAAGTPVTHLTRLSAARLRVGADAVVASRSAARLWLLPGFEASEALEFAVPRGHTPTCSGITAVRTTYLPDAAVLWHSGMPATSVTRTLHDVARLVSDETLLVAAAEAYRLGRTDPMRLLAEVHARPRTPGNARLRRIIERLDPRLARTRSVAEIIGQLRLVPLGYTDFEVNVRLTLTTGRNVEVDILFRGRRILEIMSQRWHGSPVKQRQDAERRAELEADGYVVAELWASELDSPDRVRAVVEGLLARTPRRLWTP